MKISDSPSSRWKCLVAYDGTTFSGWQSQPDKNAIQDVIEARLRTMFKQDIRIHGSGRTDAGVHAHGQVFHFDACWPHGSKKLVTALGCCLPPTIQIKSARPVPETFHSRFSAKGKIYHYEIVHGGFADPFTQAFRLSVARRLDVKAMQAAAAVLQGVHDFKTFSALGGTERETTVRNLKRLEIVARGRNLRIVAEADGFLYKMVRSLAGALVHVGTGRLTPDDIGRILAGSKRTELVETAPPQGLTLVKVFY